MGKKDAATRGRAGRAMASRLLASAVIASTIAAAPAALACQLDQGTQALTIRSLQSHLMVAGLSCGQSAQYNRFVGQFQSELVRQGQSLKTYFNRQYGGAGRREMNSYVTRMANEASQRSMINRRAFCDESLAVFEALGGTANGDLVTYVTTNAPFAIRPEGCATRTAENR